MRILMTTAIAIFGAGLMISPVAAQNPQQERMKSCNTEARDKKLSGKPRKDFLSDCLSAKTTAPLNPQRQKMTDCNASAAAQKLSGAARRKFMSSCLSGSGQASPQAAPTPAPAPTTAPTSRPSERATSPVNPQRQKMTDCNASAAAQKLSGAARRKFMSSCLSGSGQDSPQAAPTTAPAPTTTTAPTTRPSTTTATPPSTTSPSTQTSAAPAGAGQHTTEMQARIRCPLDTVVWVNLNSRIYHFKGNRNYGNTKSGAYMCEKDASAAGSRAAKNEKHP